MDVRPSQEPASPSRLNRRVMNSRGVAGAMATSAQAMPAARVAASAARWAAASCGSPSGAAGVWSKRTSAAGVSSINRWARTPRPVAPASTTVLVATLNAPTNLSSLVNGRPTVNWTDDVDSLGYYVTDEAAKTPLGPGPVTEGETYWAVSTASFPTGFRGPVVYGEVPMGGMDVSEDSMAPLGGAPLPAGSCVKLTLVFSDFKSSVLRYKTP